MTGSNETNPTTGDSVTNMNIVSNLLEKIGELIDAKITRSTVVNSKGEVTKKITIEYK